jgi:energy-coupling factor transporter ATP-binding protein EcfA2
VSILLPSVPLGRVLDRVAAIWAPDAAPHHLVYGQTGSGKTTLIKALIGLCEYERILILDPKPHADPVWDGPAEDPHRWGKPVTRIPARFGFEGDPGGGPCGLRYRLIGSPDRAETGRRFGDALATVAAEGHCVLVLDDVRETCRQLRLGEHVDSVMNLGRSANVLVILAATETGYVSGRAQAAITWAGHTTGLDAAKAAAGLLGWRGRERQDLCAAVEPHAWIYSDSQPGNAGPCITRAQKELRPHAGAKGGNFPC